MCLNPGADHVTRRPVGIHMIRTVLGIIFDDEDRGALPYRTLAYCFDKLPDRVVIVGNLRFGREFAGRRSLGVIVIEPHRHKSRDRLSAGVLEQHLLELAFPLREAARHVVLAILSPRVQTTIYARGFTIGVVVIVAAIIEVTNAAKIVAGWLEARTGWIVVRNNGRGSARHTERVVEAVISV